MQQPNRQSRRRSPCTVVDKGTRAGCGGTRRNHWSDSIGTVLNRKGSSIVKQISGRVMKKLLTVGHALRTAEWPLIAVRQRESRIAASALLQHLQLKAVSMTALEGCKRSVQSLEKKPAKGSVFSPRASNAPRRCTDPVEMCHCRNRTEHPASSVLSVTLVSYAEPSPGSKAGIPEYKVHPRDLLPQSQLHLRLMLYVTTSSSSKCRSQGARLVRFTVLILLFDRL